MVVRKAREEEAEKILALYRSVIDSEFCTWNVYYPGEEEIAVDLEYGNLFVLLDGDGPADGEQVIGAASIVPENELEDLPFWKEPEDGKMVCEIARIVISPEYQGRGLAKTLVTSLEEVLKERGCSAARLLVAAKNVPAYRTYLHCGFQTAGECDMYGDHYYACEKVL